MPQAIDIKGEHSSWKQIIKKKTKQNVTRRRNLLIVEEGQWEICLSKAQPCWMTGRNTARWSLIERRQSPGWQETGHPLPKLTHSSTKMTQPTREKVAPNSSNKSEAGTIHTFNQGASSPTLQPFPLKISVQKMTHRILQLWCGEKKA